MPADEAFADLMARLREGDNVAAQRIFNRFTNRLIALARLRLDSRVRQKVDPEDVLQSVYKSFFLRHAGGQFTLETWDNLWCLLVVITVRKCGEWADHFRADKRDVGREIVPRLETDSAPNWEALARDPTPSEVIILGETLEQLLGFGPVRDVANALSEVGIIIGIENHDLMVLDFIGSLPVSGRMSSRF